MKKQVRIHKISCLPTRHRPPKKRGYGWMDGPTDGQTDGQTDRPTDRHTLLKSCGSRPKREFEIKKITHRKRTSPYDLLLDDASSYLHNVIHFRTKNSNNSTCATRR